MLMLSGPVELLFLLLGLARLCCVSELAVV